MQAEKECEMARSMVGKTLAHLHFWVASSANFFEHCEAISFQQRRRDLWLCGFILIIGFEIVVGCCIRTFS